MEKLIIEVYTPKPKMQTLAHYLGDYCSFLGKGDAKKGGKKIDQMYAKADKDGN